MTIPGPLGSPRTCDFALNKRFAELAVSEHSRWMNGKQQHRLLAVLADAFGAGVAGCSARRGDGWPTGLAGAGNRRVKGLVLS